MRQVPTNLKAVTNKPGNASYPTKRRAKDRGTAFHSNGLTTWGLPELFGARALAAVSLPWAFVLTLH